MKLYQIAEALSVVLEINADDTKRQASFHLGCGGDLDIDVYPDGRDYDRIICFSAWSFGKYDMREYLDLDADIVGEKDFDTFAEMIEAVREAGNESFNVQADRQRCRVSRIPERTVSKGEL